MYETYNPMFNQQPAFNGGYYGAPNPMGFQYAQRPQPKSTQPLTVEQINALRNNINQDDWKVTTEEIWKAICTHKDKTTGMTTLVPAGIGPNPDPNHVRCTICGEEFTISNATEAEVTAKVRDMNNILQTIKTVYGDAPESLISNFFQILPLIKKVPNLHKQSSANFNTYENYNGNPTAVGNNYNAFGILNAMSSGQLGMYGQAQYGQPMYPGMGMQPNMGYAPQQAPMGYVPQQAVPQNYGQPVPMQNMYPQSQYGQPVPQMNMQAPMGYAQNPFGVGVPTQMPNMAPPAGMMPQQPQAQAAPQQPQAPAQAPANQDVTQTKSFNV